MGRQKKRKIDQISVTSSQAVGKDFDSKASDEFPRSREDPSGSAFTIPSAPAGIDNAWI